MATVYFSSSLTQYTGGLERVEIEAPRVHELVLALAERFPALATQQLEQMAVAIDGQIYHNAAYHKLKLDSEIHFLLPIAGG